MKKLMIILISLMTIGFSASAANTYREDGFTDLVYGIETNLANNGYLIERITSNKIYAVKADMPKIEKKENDNYVAFKFRKKINVPTITVTFALTENGYIANVERDKKKIEVKDIPNLIKMNSYYR